MKPFNEKREGWSPHSPKCQRASFGVGLDLAGCGRCRSDAALEIVKLRAFRLMHEVLL